MRGSITTMRQYKIKILVVNHNLCFNLKLNFLKKKPSKVKTTKVVKKNENNPISPNKDSFIAHNKSGDIMEKFIH